MSKIIKKYKHVTTKMKMLQINSNAIIEPIITLMKGKEDFCDTFDTLEEKIYRGDIFTNILNGIKEREKNGYTLVDLANLKTRKQLKELEKLAKKYDYIHLTNVK